MGFTKNAAGIKQHENKYRRCWLCKEVYSRSNFYELEHPVQEKHSRLPIYVVCKPCFDKMEDERRY